MRPNPLARQFMKPPNRPRNNAAAGLVGSHPRQSSYSTPFISCSHKTPADEAKGVAKFEEEGLKAGDQPVFELAFPPHATEPEKFEVVGALEHLVRLLRQMLRQATRVFRSSINRWYSGEAGTIG